MERLNRPPSTCCLTLRHPIFTVLMPDLDRLKRAYETARQDLLAERTSNGHWVGELSSSALSTATAVSALSLVRQGSGNQAIGELVERGIQYLCHIQNTDGGWGDTDRSLSNIATTMLVRAAFHLAGAAERHGAKLAAAERYIEKQGGLAGLRRRYGRDKTFVVPILTNCALAGLAEWADVAPLPFELACFPQGMFRFLRLPVVSYAIPALVAIGQARYFHRPPINPLVRLGRRWAVEPSLSVLERMQPESGGYLEATPLTSFVVMSLAGTGRADHAVARRGVQFLIDSVRPDGSWPIDTNLATWTTTLSINALAAAGEVVDWPECLDWLLKCQHVKRHPFTGAEPGGWAWTDLSGGVPDADDTPGALLALAAFRRECAEGERSAIDQAAGAGARWLVGLQNRDGGWPTFCRGWGKLPFDRSGVDLTAHALRALAAWRGAVPVSESVFRSGLGFLERQQRPEGEWIPLWFGDQFRAEEENPVYGTARVLLAYAEMGLGGTNAARRAMEWLVRNQNRDGGWGAFRAAGESSVEETAVVLEALTALDGLEPVPAAVERGLAWLVEAVESGRHVEPTPIGLYFARLWYYERLYPRIFTAAALGRACRKAASCAVRAAT